MYAILTPKPMLTRAFIFVFALCLNACAIFGDPVPLDETKGWTEQRLYAAGQEQMVDRNYDKAIDYFKKIEIRYPNGIYATQAQLETAFAYYKKSDPILCISTVDRFIKLHPNHPQLDYAYYLKGLATFNERGFIERITKQQINDRDPKTLKVSFAAFKELTDRYPKSRYYKDASQRMLYLVNALGTHEMHVAHYYMERGAYIAAANRAKYVLEVYPNSTAVEDALATMVKAYDAMEAYELKADALRVLKINYPDNPVALGKVDQKEKIWWKFWESL